QCRVSIADLGADNNSLSISGDILAEIPDIFEYLLSSPVTDSVDFLSIFDAQGKSQVALALEIPFSSEGEFSFNATGELADNKLEILPADLSLDALNGKLHISMAGLEIEQINGLLYGEPIKINAKILDEIPGGATQIQAITSLTGEMLSQYFDLSLFSNLMSGTGSLSAEVFLPYHPTLAQRGSSVLLESNLEGVALALPGTLKKQPEEQRKVVVELQLAEEKPVLAQINYDGGIAALLSFDQPRLRGKVVLGEPRPLQLPEQPGLTISGELSEFSLSELLTLLPEPPEQSKNEPILLRSLNLTLDELELFGQQLQSVELNATRTDWQWLINIDSPQAKGRIQFSEQGSREPVIADMVHLHLSKQPDVETNDETPERTPLDMKKLPPLQIQVQQLSYDNLSLGAMTLNSHWIGPRYQLEELLLHPDSARLSLHGLWNPNPLPLGESYINLWLDSEDIGRTISGLGYAGAINKGEGSVNAAIQWFGGFGEFEAAKINGKIEFKLEDGRILDVEPGAGRVLGLLSLQMLPRRLLFDFGDLFGKGFSFDEIRGHYEMDSGVAKTDNLTMLGASARVDLLGSVDLGKQEYDQRLIVTPFVTGSLPMLTYLTGVATPQIAAVIFLAQKVFQDDLEKMAQFEYHVSGPWDNPNVVKVDEEKPVEQE
ncbi:FIG005080: Possible exported protein, partial [hydrothermal vent metagenome]